MNFNMRRRKKHSVMGIAAPTRTQQPPFLERLSRKTLLTSTYSQKIYLFHSGGINIKHASANLHIIFQPLIRSRNNAMGRTRGVGPSKGSCYPRPVIGEHKANFSIFIS
jgi:hypothetical protein